MRTLWIGWVAFGLAVVVSFVPASLAQDSGVLDHGKPAGTGVEAEEVRQTHGELSGGLSSEAPGHAGVFIVAPIGKVGVGPASVEGEPTYVRRTKASEGMTIVEVSATPFMPALQSSVAELIAKPDQPAGW
jgi:hypothetical protein